MKLVYQPSELCPPLDPITAAFFWRSKADRLLKVDIDIHQPGIVDANSGNFPPVIPKNEQQTASRCSVIVNNDNDDLDSIFVTPYPEDNDDEVLKLREPFTGKVYSDEDVVMVTLRKFDSLNTGKIKLTSDSNADIRFFKYTDGQYTLDAIDAADLVVDLSNPDPESPLTDLLNEDVSFYIEGRNANDDLKISMILENENGTELTRQSVNMQILGIEQTIGLVAIANSSLSESTVQSYLTKHIQGANAVRRDRDGYDGDADTLVPALFRLDTLLPADSANPDWSTVTYGGSSTQDELSDVLEFLSQDLVDADIYVASSIKNHTNTVLPSGVTTTGAAQGMCVSLTKPKSRVIAHEWLHAYGNKGHICIDHHLMTGIPNGESSCGAVDGHADTRQDETNTILNYSW